VVRQIVAGYRKIDPDVPRHLVQMPLLTYTLFSSRHQRIEPGENDGHPPLIFVHGLGGGRGDFLLMAYYLRLKGRKRHYRIKFPKGQSIEEMAASLAQFIREVTKVTQQKKVDLVVSASRDTSGAVSSFQGHQGFETRECLFEKAEQKEMAETCPRCGLLEPE
jgi:hypothetical protein